MSVFSCDIWFCKDNKEWTPNEFELDDVEHSEQPTKATNTHNKQIEHKQTHRDKEKRANMMIVCMVNGEHLRLR